MISLGIFFRAFWEQNKQEMPRVLQIKARVMSKDTTNDNWTEYLPVSSIARFKKTFCVLDQLFFERYSSLSVACDPM